MHGFPILLLFLLCSNCETCRIVILTGSSSHPLVGNKLKYIFTSSSHNLLNQTSSARIPFTPYDNLSPNFPSTLETKGNRNKANNLDGWGVYISSSSTSPSTFIKNESPITQSPHFTTFLNSTNPPPSSLIFAHVRAATPPSSPSINQNIAVNYENTHPFQYSISSTTTLTFMHNGCVSNAIDHQIRTQLQMMNLSGNTDSELAGGIFAIFYREQTQTQTDDSASLLESAMVKTLDRLQNPLITNSYIGGCQSDGSSLNFAATADDGDFVATRYRSCSTEDPPTLYLGMVKEGWGKPDKYCGFREICSLTYLTEGSWIAPKGSVVVVASEPLETENGQNGIFYGLLPKDSLISFNSKTNTVRISCLSTVCKSLIENKHRRGANASANEGRQGNMNLAVIFLFGVVVWFVAVATTQKSKTN
ncbi:hypothetical protein ScalyP_jg1451 [Parmales sp. scaly parma]|nr:hypothetical protein ScalyP_jg1451 [Parmales sp. scaly parma]